MTNNNDDKRPMRPVYEKSPSRDFLDSFLENNEKGEQDASETVDKNSVPDQPSLNDFTDDNALMPSTAMDPIELGTMNNVDAISKMRETIIEGLQTIYDPEIPVNLYDLGLIYEVNIDDDNNVQINMTLTTPHCPVAESMPGEVQAKVLSVEGVSKVSVALVWEPPWDMSCMSEEARLELGFI